MSKITFVNQNTGKKYKVVKFDKEANKLTLVGEHGVEFTETYDKAMFQKLGYRLKEA